MVAPPRFASGRGQDGYGLPHAPTRASNGGCPKERTLRRLWENYSLSLTLAALFIVSWLLQTWSGWMQFAGEQQQHEQAAAVFGPDGYLWHWLEATMENWQSEFLQLFTFVVLTTFLVHRHSHESRDTDEEMQATLQRIEQQLGELREGRKK
jgi:hypothetical protein